ncbi:MAG: class I tRNA ligase family protein [Bacteroidales bacterium]|nr:class I tRNA ligase family protein [Bacteroidales bacterium]MDD4672575.1 class I tRNA ligase family protein [Bacteroidales bacterium]
MDYNFSAIDSKWQQYWKENRTYKVDIDISRPKFYVLDMFPYPSGAGLHVGHPLGYIASDIYSRYKRLQGFNVLHPMGYDAFGLPAEQYAIQTGQHPAITTEINIKRYREQLDKIGFSYDWDREVRTCSPDYYHWTQWTFIKMFKHWYNNTTQKAEPIEALITEFEKDGNAKVNAACSEVEPFSANEWSSMNEKQQQEILLAYRLAYLADTMVNWCPALGTVLANDEVKDGFSVRGGHPVEQRKMKQWCLRISAYAERLLNDLDTLDWSDSLKEIQRNWIGRSEGAEVTFKVDGTDNGILVFTTRPDTIYGATFMVLAPESELVSELTTPEHKQAVEEYITMAKRKTERERQTEVKKVSGQFTGSYAINPFTEKKIPIWISEYVLGGYGTGAIMAVPAHDSRDFVFAKTFGLPIVQTVIQPGETPTDPATWTESYDAKEGIVINSDTFNGLEVQEAISTINANIEKQGLGRYKVNYRLRDAIFSRQRYWGEPFPVYYKDGMPYTIDEDKLPLELPEVDAYLPTEKGEPPLGRAKNWQTAEGYPYELSTMPGFAGSSAYYLRYMDPKNSKELVSKEANEYWENVDLYIGGTEHATGHLVYSRFWNKFLFDLGYVCKNEPFKKLVNQGMIQGRSSFVYRINPEKMAEYVLWEHLKDKKMGVEFVRNYRIGNSKFDFFSPDAKVLIEVKKQQSLEKVAEPYEALAAEKGYKLLLIPIQDFMGIQDEVLHRIKEAIEGKDVPAFVEKDHIEKFPAFVSKNIPGREHFSDEIHVDISLVENDILNVEEFRKWQPHLSNARFLLEDEKYVCGWAVEKMSKSMYNVVNPDDIVEKYGADTLRIYEMFLGPLEQSKPWDTNGIDGVLKFLRRLWRLAHDANNEVCISNEPATNDELKVLHKTIKKISDNIEKFSFNTGVSAFMICVNELNDLKCNKREVLEPLTILIAPYAPHTAEELWHLLGHKESVFNAQWPELKEEYLVEDSFTCPISFNGKTRFTLDIPLNMPKDEVEKLVFANEQTDRYLHGKTPRKVIIVPNKIVNIVI